MTVSNATLFAQQVVNAAAGGGMAAGTLNNELVFEDVDAAVPADARV